MQAVRPLSERDRRDTAALPFDEAAFVADVGGIAAGEPGFSIRERLTLRPAIDVNGMWGGYTGSGSKTVFPDEARAKITIRLAPGQDPEQAADALKAHILAVARPGVAISFEGIGAARRPRRSLPITRWYRLGATVPITAIFKETLGLDTLMFGFNLPDEDVHAPNEFFHLASLALGLRAWPMLLEELGHFDAKVFGATASRQGA